MVYSASPIYGKPGIFLATCAAAPVVKMIVAPVNADAAYPQGADYFEIRSVSNGRVQYLYGADVDTTDFTKLRSTDSNVRSVDLPPSD
jgi:hypothetical protein